MTGDPDADEHTDKEDDDEDDDEVDNNNSMNGGRIGDSESDDSSQAGYSSECGTTSSSVNNHELTSSSLNRVTAPSSSTINNSTPSTRNPHSIGGILSRECSTSRINSAQQSSSISSQRDSDSNVMSASKSIIHATWIYYRTRTRTYC